jgi:hypothetical protein
MNRVDLVGGHNDDDADRSLTVVGGKKKSQPLMPLSAERQWFVKKECKYPHTGTPSWTAKVP